MVRHDTHIYTKYCGCSYIDYLPSSSNMTLHTIIAIYNFKTETRHLHNQVKQELFNWKYAYSIV
jgi:hypothetical protein